jgi:hypothetical protein
MNTENAPQSGRGREVWLLAAGGALLLAVRGICGFAAAGPLLGVGIIAAAGPLLGVGIIAAAAGHKHGAPPVVGMVRHLESDLHVARALGPPVSVGLAVARRFDRRMSRAGVDSVSLSTTVSGRTATGWLSLTA